MIAVALGVVAAAFVIGSLPFSFWIGKLHGVDLREHGSGNLGATNVYRVVGWKWGVAALLLDVGKGAAAVALARTVAPAGAVGFLPALAGLAAVAGHIFTPFAGFRGGKGVATGLGVFVGLAPLAAGLTFLVWAATMTFIGWVSVSSGIAALVLPVLVILTRDALGPRYPWVLGLALLTMLLVLVRHRSNWRRVVEGREQAIWEKRPETPDGGAVPPAPGARAPGPPGGGGAPDSPTVPGEDSP